MRYLMSLLYLCFQIWSRTLVPLQGLAPRNSWKPRLYLCFQIWSRTLVPLQGLAPRNSWKPWQRGCWT
ncbi:hypothetical protein RchiOBHm_Chr5g0016991 [Rosa chinensis]|uniref:Uncharacterized protein n=1 Tax=Rosa chinensis TaxID=74649 RepID=A0A2P6Q6C2_ROSCH|nr:hypothetical protein RchiOBHm_Chr5g0016991 [Rosa chinensis]